MEENKSDQSFGYYTRHSKKKEKKKVGDGLKTSVRPQVRIGDVADVGALCFTYKCAFRHALALEISGSIPLPSRVIFPLLFQLIGEQDGLVVKTPAYGSEGPWFDSRQHPFCLSGGLNSHIQAHEVYFHYLPPCPSDGTLNRGPKSIAQLVLAR